MPEAELEVEHGVDAHHSTSIPAPTPYLDVPVLIQVIDTGDAAPVAVGVVNMPHIPQPVAWVTCHHGLAETETDGGGLLGWAGAFGEEAITFFSPLQPMVSPLT